MLREGARQELMRCILGHANIDVTQNVYGKGTSGPGLRHRKAENLGHHTSVLSPLLMCRS